MSKRRDGKTKVYILDSNVLLRDPHVIDALQDNFIVIPIWAIEEFDKIKTKNDQVGLAAREISRIIKRYRRKNGSLLNGIRTDNGGMLFVDCDGAGFNDLPQWLERTRDNLIISIAKNWQKRKPNWPVILLTNDTNMEIKASACGIEVEDYEHDRVVSSIDELYTGTINIELAAAQAGLINDIYRAGFIDASLLRPNIAGRQPDFFPNQCCWLTLGDKYALAIYKKRYNSHRDVLVKIKKAREIEGKGILPRNDEQCFAYHFLNDPTIRLVTITGEAGTGKTLLALDAGIRQLGNPFSQVMVFRSIIEVENKTMGFLPGDVGEKFEPYIGPVLDCLELIFPSGDHDEIVGHGKKDIGPNGAYEGLFAQKQLVTGPINFLRGRTLHQRFVITDEVQNITQLGVKTIGTRTGKQTKMVFLGDPTQIDVPFLSSVSCGLSHVVENLKEEETAANIRLIKNERDEVAAICARRL